VNIVEALRDPLLFKPLFRDLSTWSAWLAWLKVVFDLPMTPDEQKIYRACTSRRHPPKSPTEVWTIAGRRSGKSRMASLVGVYLACFHDYTPYLAPGERATVMILARDRVQAGVIMRYIKGMLNDVPLLRRMVTAMRAEEIELNNQVSIAIYTCQYGAIRGQTLAAAICDEIGFWQVDGVNPDREILAALRPALSTIPGSKLLCLSTPYSRQGELYEMFRAHYGHWKERADLLIWRAPTTIMNPTLATSVIEQSRSRDPLAAKSEWDAEFRDDVSNCFDTDLIESCTVKKRTSLPPVRGVQYVAFVDPSGGKSDSFTLAVGHRDTSGKVIIDLLDGWKAPFSPNTVVTEVVQRLSLYGVRIVTGDRYAGQWPSEAFSHHGVRYRLCDVSKSELYLSLIPVLSSAAIELPDHKEFRYQLGRLERRVMTSGRDVVDHPSTGHDDLANAVAGVAYQLVLGKPVRRWVPVDDQVDAPQPSPDHAYLHEPMLPAGRRLTVPWRHYFG
jgi:hypothetical protein